MNDPTSCAATEAHLPLFVGGDLEPDACEQVEAHLAVCAACRGALEALTRARAAVLELSVRSPAPQVDLWPALRGTLAAEGLVRGTGVRRPLRLARVLVPLAAAAGLALTLTLVQRDGAPRGTGPAPATPTTVQMTTVQAPTAPPASLADAAPVVPASTAGLRRLLPGEERLGASAQPFPTGGVLLQPRPAAGQRPSLAGGMR